MIVTSREVDTSPASLSAGATAPTGITAAEPPPSTAPSSHGRINGLSAEGGDHTAQQLARARARTDAALDAQVCAVMQARGINRQAAIDLLQSTSPEAAAVLQLVSEAALPNAASPMDANSSSSIKDLPAIIGKTVQPQRVAAKPCQPNR